MTPDPKIAGILAAHEHMLVLLLAHQLKDMKDEHLRRAIDGLTAIGAPEGEIDPARMNETRQLIRYVTNETMERIADRVVAEVRRLQDDR